MGLADLAVVVVDEEEQLAISREKLLSGTVGGSAAVQFRNLISDFWVEPW